MDHHSVTGSSQALTSTDEASGAVTTQVTTDSTIAHKQDQQLPAACPSPVSQSDSDECCNDSPTPTRAQACPSRSTSPSSLDSAYYSIVSAPNYIYLNSLLAICYSNLQIV